MADETIRTELEYHVDDTGVRDFIGALADMSDGLEETKKQLDKFSKIGRGSVEDLRTSFRDLVDQQKIAVSELGAGMGDHFKAYQKDIEGVKGKIGELEDAAVAYNNALSSGQEDLARQKKREYQGLFKAIKKEQKEVIGSMQERSNELRKIFIEDKKAVNKYFTDELPEKMGTSMGESIKSALSGDVTGILQGAFQGAGGLARGGIQKFRNVRQQKQAKAELEAGPGGLQKGKFGKAMGGMTKAVGKVAKVIGPLMAAAGGIAMILKLLMDAEAQTKELNSQLTQSVSLFKLGAGSAELATNRMDQLRESATDFQTNLRLGLDPKQHMEVIGALEEHDASITELAKNYESFGRAATDIVSTVRYASLNLATDMQSVSEFIGTMKSLHRATMPEIKEDLTVISKKAEESGMNTKKFFSTISQLSGQMDLYNYKLEDTAYLLGEMSKFMDPKNAKAFVESITTGFKDKSPTDRLKDMLIATGGNVSKMTDTIRESVDGMFDSLNPKAMDSARQRMEALGKDTSNMKKAITSLSDTELSSVIRDIRDTVGEDAATQFQQTAVALKKVEGGALSAADAAGNLDAFAQMENQMKKVQFMAKQRGKDMFTIEAAITEKVGVDEKQLKRLQSVYGRYTADVTELQSAFEAFKQGSIGAEEFNKMAEEMGVMAEINEEGKMVNEKTGNEIQGVADYLRALKEEDLAELGLDEDAQKSMAQKQVEATDSVANILQYMIYDILNTIGTHVSDIGIWIRKIFSDTSDEEIKAAELANDVMKQRQKVAKLEMKKKKAQDKGDQKAMEAADTELKFAREQLKSLKSKHEGARRMADLVKKGASTSAITEAGLQGEMGLGTDEFETRMHEGMSMASSRGVRFKYAERAGRERTYRGLHGGKTLGRLSEVHTPQGKITDPKAIREWVKEQAKASKAREKAEENIEERISEGNSTNEDLKKLQQESVTIFKQTGAKLNDSTIKKMTEEHFKEARKEKTVDEIVKAYDGSISRDQAEAYVNAARSGQQLPAVKGSRKARDIVKRNYGASESDLTWGDPLESGKDARLVTSGVVPLNLKAGDMVVDRASLAKTIRGSTGEFAPDLLNEVAKGRGGGGGRSGMIMHNTFNIDGGNPQEVETTILRVLEMAKRKSMGES